MCSSDLPTVDSNDRETIGLRHFGGSIDNISLFCYDTFLKPSDFVATANFRTRVDMIILVSSVVMVSPSLEMVVMDDDSLRVLTIGWSL